MIFEVKSERQACFFGHVKWGRGWREGDQGEGESETNSERAGEAMMWLRPNKGTDALGRGDKSTEAMISTVLKFGLRAPFLP